MKLQDQIAAIVEDRGEGLLNDSGVDKRVCREIAGSILDLLTGRVQALRREIHGEIGDCAPENETLGRWVKDLDAMISTRVAIADPDLDGLHDLTGEFDVICNQIIDLARRLAISDLGWQRAARSPGGHGRSQPSEHDRHITRELLRLLGDSIEELTVGEQERLQALAEGRST